MAEDVLKRKRNFKRSRALRGKFHPPDALPPSKGLATGPQGCASPWEWLGGNPAGSAWWWGIPGIPGSSYTFGYLWIIFVEKEQSKDVEAKSSSRPSTFLAHPSSMWVCWGLWMPDIHNFEFICICHQTEKLWMCLSTSQTTTAYQQC